MRSVAWLSTQGSTLLWRITRFSFVVEPSKLQSEETNRGQGFQIYGKYWPATHWSRNTAHAQWQQNVFSTVVNGRRHNS